MKLRQKGRWRKWFGLKGHIWYFAPDPERKRFEWSPAVWSAVIAAMGVITTALFAYQNYYVSRENFVLTHPPEVHASDLLVRRIGTTNSVKFELVVLNDGETMAKNVYATIQEGYFNDRSLTEKKNVARHDNEVLHASGAVTQPLPNPEHPGPIFVDLDAHDADGEIKGHQSLCGEWENRYEGQWVKLHSCGSESIPRSKLDQE